MASPDAPSNKIFIFLLKPHCLASCDALTHKIIIKSLCVASPDALTNQINIFSFNSHHHNPLNLWQKTKTNKRNKKANKKVNKQANTKKHNKYKKKIARGFPLLGYFSKVFLQG